MTKPIVNLPADCEGANGVMSPDGSRAALTCSDGSIDLVSLDGTEVAMPLIGTPAGWLDRSHLVWQNQSEAARIDDLAASSDTAVLAAGFYAGTLPGGL